MTCLTEMNEAIARAGRLRLNCPGFKPQNGKLLTEKTLKEIPSVVKDTVGYLSVSAVAGQCLSYHLRLRSALRDYFGTEVTYTIGYVSMGEETIFEQTEEQMKGLMSSKGFRPLLNIHAWLTLPTCEVMDFTLPTTYAVMNQTEQGYGEGYGGVIAGHADHLQQGVRYRPMLLGEDYLRKIGALLEF